jgi:hypothetical protein
MLTIKPGHYQAVGKPGPIFDTFEPHIQHFDCSVTISDHKEPFWARGYLNKRSARAEAARAALTWLQQESIELTRPPTQSQQNPHSRHNTSLTVVTFTQPIQHEDSRSGTDESAPSSSESAIELIASSLPPSVITT